MPFPQVFAGCQTEGCPILTSPWHHPSIGPTGTCLLLPKLLLLPQGIPVPEILALITNSASGPSASARQQANSDIYLSGEAIICSLQAQSRLIHRSPMSKKMYWIYSLFSRVHIITQTSSSSVPLQLLPSTPPRNASCHWMRFKITPQNTISSVF